MAAFLREDTRLTLAENAHLVKSLRSHRRLLAPMQMWVAQNNAVQLGPTTLVRWHQVTLTDDPVSRKLVKEWAIRRMYHNTAVVFRGLPSSCDDDVCITSVEYSQYVWDAPLEVTRRKCCNTTWTTCAISTNFDPTSVKLQTIANT
ncbi:hypothetical protein H257_07523 [Aphanomyces astaci]|uniref:Uncharacterized protein n=1 Tax=Aphanomyces astaci TaxID=112090 RepID=W4GIA7_APHAT|nr:hypothetical protein H257_07523 [Aphanomyces astaci]ETV78663.1 hypothetical protein H257_07523 [Aphanomyces astaci]|eukprot:XP_009831382.1 hypothetical protein H257_07523 [Aphanomyces astaci]